MTECRTPTMVCRAGHGGWRSPNLFGQVRATASMSPLEARSRNVSEEDPDSGFCMPCVAENRCVTKACV
eukprot:5236327-Pleurochrysis_carterae.AAC.1